jgi:hypothetical protein
MPARLEFTGLKIFDRKGPTVALDDRCRAFLRHIVAE